MRKHAQTRADYKVGGTALTHSTTNFFTHTIKKEASRHPAERNAAECRLALFGYAVAPLPCYLVRVMMSVAIEMSVPMELTVSVSAGGTDHDERAFEALGST